MRIKPPSKAILRVLVIAITAVMCTLVILSAVFPFPEGTWDFLSIGTSQKVYAATTGQSTYTIGMSGIGDSSTTITMQGITGNRPVIAYNSSQLYNDWRYRKSHNITGAANAGTNYQVKINVYSGSGSDSGDNVYLSGHCTNFPNDIKFTDDDRTTSLDHWCEDPTANPAVFWVEVADSLTNNQTIDIWYGKNGQATSINGTNTFLFWDHFDVDLSNWTTGGTPTIASSILTLNAVNENVRTSGTYGTNTALRGRFYYTAKAGSGEGNYFQYGSWADSISRAAICEESAYSLLYYSWDDSGTYQQTDLADMARAYHIYEIRRNSTTSVIFALDDSIVATHTTRVGTLARYIGFYCIADTENILSDWILVRKYVSPEPSNGAWGVEEDTSPTISNSPSSKDFGILEIGTSSVTTIGYFTITNTGNCRVNVMIQGTNLAGGDDVWTLSGDGTSGVNIYGLKAGLDDADDNFDVVVNMTPNAFISNLAEDATQSWGLNLTMPTSVTNYDAQEMGGTITLVVSAT